MTFDLPLRRLIGDTTLKALNLKEKDLLTFVYETVYNSGPVTIIKEHKKEGCFTASLKEMFKSNVKVRDAKSEHI